MPHDRTERQNGRSQLSDALILSKSATTLTYYGLAIEALAFPSCLIPIRQTACFIWCRRGRSACSSKAQD
ncbi:MAG: hypothetical protein HC895_16720 [Leptolyngbyaceae cyanobacterium SM1_3_5]|nr:hypothetical protein [Leptolyngbyaceae cyanobacterium SM1_3_5]